MILYVSHIKHRVFLAEKPLKVLFAVREACLLIIKQVHGPLAGGPPITCILVCHGVRTPLTHQNGKGNVSSVCCPKFTSTTPYYEGTSEPFLLHLGATNNPVPGEKIARHLLQPMESSCWDKGTPGERNPQQGQHWRSWGWVVLGGHAGRAVPCSLPLRRQFAQGDTAPDGISGSGTTDPGAVDHTSPKPLHAPDQHEKSADQQHLRLR